MFKRRKNEFGKVTLPHSFYFSKK